MSNRRVLVVMARWPAPGRCKSRLAAGNGRVRAAAVHERLERHTCAVGQGRGGGGLSLRLRLQGSRPALFSGIPWGSDEVLEHTRRATAGAEPRWQG